MHPPAETADPEAGWNTHTLRQLRFNSWQVRGAKQGIKTYKI